MPTIQKLSNGKYRALVRRKGISKTRVFDTRQSAVTWSLEIEKSITSGSTAGTIAVPASITLANLIDSYVKERPPGRSGLAALKVVSGMIGHVSLSKLTGLHVNDMVQKLMKRGVAGATVVGYLSPLSSVLKYGRFIKNLDINHDLAKDARTGLTIAKVNTRSTQRERLPTEDELKRLYAYFETLRPGIPMVDIVKFAATSGMRLGEIVRIKLEDIDWEQKSVLIEARKHPTKKSTNHQTVALFGDALDIAAKIHQTRQSGRVFPYDGRSVSTSFQRATRAIGIEDLHFHDLRHYALTQLFKRGLPIEMVATISGHQSWSILKRYVQLTPTDFHDALDKLK